MQPAGSPVPIRLGQSCEGGFGQDLLVEAPMLAPADTGIAEISDGGGLTRPAHALARPHRAGGTLPLASATMRGSEYLSQLGGSWRWRRGILSPAQECLGQPPLLGVGRPRHESGEEAVGVEGSQQFEAVEPLPIARPNAASSLKSRRRLPRQRRISGTGTPSSTS
jgi:hypothetical protein